MSLIVVVIDSLIRILRLVFLGGAGILALVALLDWLVRTRRINAFSRVARFTRHTIDPLIVPVERHVVRAGGLPTTAPLWALGGAILAGIIVLTLLGFLRKQLAMSAIMMHGAPRGIVVLIISWSFQILRLALLIRVISSWIRVSPYSRWVHWTFVLTEPLLRPLRKVIPAIGMIDITPIVAYFALGFLEAIVLGAIQ